VLAPLAIVYISAPVALFAVLVLTYTGLGCFTLMMATIPAETVPRHLVATCLGAIMGAGEIIGGFIAPWLAGLLSDAFGLQMSMFIPAVAAAAVVGLSFGLIETAPLRRTLTT
jgi:fucose permease